MFETMEKALEAYKKELSAFAEAKKKAKARYGPDGLYWPESEYKNINSLGDRLKAMVVALGLTKEEDTAIDRECGLIES